jgi:hypothetical protein
MNPLATPFGGYDLPAVRAGEWSPTVQLPSLPGAGCVGCSDWSAPVAPWQSTVLAGPKLSSIDALPTL